MKIYCGTITSFLTLVALLSSNINYVHGKRVNGVVETNKDWAFITRFCFLSSDGWIRYQFFYPLENCCLNLLFYYDEPHQWRSAYRTNKTCSQREALLSRVNNQIIKMVPTDLGSGCIRVTIDGKDMLRCTYARMFSSYRARWWYIAISNCNKNPDQLLYLKYDINMTNGRLEWNKQFSADEIGILETDITYLIFFVTLSIISVVVAVMLKERQLLHSTYKYYMASLLLQTFGLVFIIIHYTIYASNGYGIEFLRLLGRLCIAASELVFLLLIILLAKGFTVVRGKISPSGLVKIAVLMTLYVIAYIALYIYEARFFDPGHVIYLYESPAGYGLLGLRIIAWAWFLYANFITIKKFPDKRPFYMWFTILYSFWFLAVPVMVLFSYYLIANWVRAKVVNGIELSINLFAYAIFLGLTWPSHSNATFPFHIRTTQIAAMNEDARLDNANGHAYQVEDDGKPRDIVEMFAAKPNYFGPVLSN